MDEEDEMITGQRFFIVFYTGKKESGEIVQSYIDTGTIDKEYISATDMIKRIQETEGIQSVCITNVIELSESDAMDWVTETIDKNHPDFEKFERDINIDMEINSTYKNHKTLAILSIPARVAAFKETTIDLLQQGKDIAEIQISINNFLIDEQYEAVEGIKSGIDYFEKNIKGKPMNVYQFQIQASNYYVTAQTVEAAYTVLPIYGKIPLAFLAHKQLSETECNEMIIPAHAPVFSDALVVVSSFTNDDDITFTQELSAMAAFGITKPKIMMIKPIK